MCHIGACYWGLWKQKGWAGILLGNPHLFAWMFRMQHESLSHFVYSPLCSQTPLLTPPPHPPLPTNISHVLAVSLHAACFTKPFTVLYTFSIATLHPLFLSFSASLRLYKQWKDQKVRRGAKSFCHDSIWLCFRWAVHTLHAENKATQVNMHTLFFQVRHSS